MALEIIGEHLFMVAAQKNRCREGGSEFKQVIDYAGAGRSTIDVVAEKYDLIADGRHDLIHQRIKLIQTAVDIADGKQSVLLSSVDTLHHLLHFTLFCLSVKSRKGLFVVQIRGILNQVQTFDFKRSFLSDLWRRVYAESFFA